MNNIQFTKKYYINRKKTNSVKYQMCKKGDYLPMWIADMDFKCDERVARELSKYIEFGDYGYANIPEDYYKVFINWHKTRNNVTYKQDWIRFSYGAVDAMYQVLYTFSKPNDLIMINTPLYPPFKATIEQTGRKVLSSKMINNNGYFTLDFNDIERKFKTKKVKILMLCSPHNPVGRVYKKGELETLFELCKKYNVLVCSDEVHSDIIMPDQTFIPSLAFKKYHDIIISIVAASKSFSLAVFNHCHIIIPNEKLRNKLIKYQQINHRYSLNAFCCLPTYYNYKYGAQWMDDLNNVVYENYQYFYDNLHQHFEMTNLEGSYLLFLNLGKYNDENSAAKSLEKNCKIIVNPGESFDSQYNNWVRINLATSLANVKKAVNSIKKYYLK